MKNRKWKVFATFCCTFVTNNADEWRVLARVYFMLTTEAFHVRRSRHEWPATSARTQTTAKGHDIPRAHHETHSAPRPLAVGSTRPRRRRRARRIGSSANQADPRRIPRRCPVRSSPARVPIDRRGDTRDRPRRVPVSRRSHRPRSCSPGRARSCHAAGGNVVQAGATLFPADLTRNGVNDAVAVYDIIYGGKGKMPGYGEGCAPKGQCTFGARLSDGDVGVSRGTSSSAPPRDKWMR